MLLCLVNVDQTFHTFIDQKKREPESFDSGVSYLNHVFRYGELKKEPSYGLGIDVWHQLARYSLLLVVYRFILRKAVLRSSSSGNEWLERGGGLVYLVPHHCLALRRWGCHFAEVPVYELKVQVRIPRGHAWHSSTSCMLQQVAPSMEQLT